MPKFNFDNSRFASFFQNGGGVNMLQSYIDMSEMIRINYGWWRTQFSVNPNVTPTDDKGVATFTIEASTETSAPMMDLRAPMGQAIPLDTEGLSYYSATIPDFISPAIHETAMEREYKRKTFEQFGNDASIIKAWTQKVQTLVDGKDQTMNNMAAQLESTGKIKYTFGRGAKSKLIKAEIPTENFYNAGAPTDTDKKVWTAPDAKILSMMVNIEDDFRQRTGFQGAMKWLVTYDMMHNVILKNKEVLEWVNYYRNLNTNSPQAAPEISIIPEDLFARSVVSYPGLSPIEVVVEKEKNLTWDKVEMVQGWKEGVAVLRPVGDAGMIMHTDILDEQLISTYGNKMIESVFANLDGFSRLVNTTVPNGQLKEWNTCIMMSAVPALTEFPQHCIIDTTKVS